MIIFWIIAALLILVAILFIAPSLLRSHQTLTQNRNQQNVVIAQERLSEIETDLANGVISQEQFEKTKLELEQALLLDLSDDEKTESVEAPKGPGRMAMAGLAVTVPAMAVGLYLFLGTPQLLEEGGANATVSNEVAGHDGDTPSIDEMINSRVQRLESNPEDAEGWFMLGRTRMAMGEYSKAVQAFENVYKLVGDQTVILLALADAQAMLQQRGMSGRPTELIRKAVQLSPEDTTALWLAGLVEQQAGNYELALKYLKRLETKLSDDPGSLAKIKDLIAEVSQKLGREPVQDAASAPAAAVSSVKVRIALAPEFQSEVNPEESIFVYAKALQGPRMPLAAARHQVKDLPLELELDDSTAMMPEMRISKFSEVTVGARISRSGNAIAQSGDLVGEISPVNVAASGVTEIVINSRMP
ncbi:c-type cytochrome biogenesis protein CcmI [Solemya velesiana gill symbiont]|uniref:C-type cytochrome biogenesis protein CcmI n=1 Tax=Solemya velesiana gill symbiont TaxID=1918948 RepID=A0A1T2KX05_9GAMM|nr:c-type cytochrome biogenesis protein CcmI [Solemya velesiana gill symbiont]OOZ37334.1 c-type cytochrome biogenesis protein CcmI [Solemya velesiana gill symbiont]